MRKTRTSALTLLSSTSITLSIVRILPSSNRTSALTARTALKFLFFSNFSPRSAFLALLIFVLGAAEEVLEVVKDRVETPGVISRSRLLPTTKHLSSEKGVEDSRRSVRRVEESIEGKVQGSQRGRSDGAGADATDSFRLIRWGIQLFEFFLANIYSPYLQHWTRSRRGTRPSVQVAPSNSAKLCESSAAQV